MGVCFPSGVLAAAVILLIHSQQTECIYQVLGKCPTRNPTQTLAADPFVPGTWYEAYRFPDFRVADVRCIKYVFGAGAAGPPATHTLTVSGKELYWATVSTPGTVTETAATGSCTVDFNHWTFSLTPQGPFLPTYTVINAVAGSYMILYSCQQNGRFMNVDSLILTASQTPTSAVTDAALNDAQTAGILKSSYIRSNQSNC